MKSLAKPTITVKEVFTMCISTVFDPALKQELRDCIDVLEDGEIDFDNKFINNEIYQISQNAIILGNIEKSQMTTVYDYRMVKSGMPGNVYYNQIKAAAHYGKCPLCSVRAVDTLDHYLPKSKYPIYAVTPVNLIPACTPCNKGKHIDFPKTSEEQTLHPYYDNIENDSWLNSTISRTNPISFQYHVNAPNTWTQILKDRTANHFHSFNLNQLFSAHANEELRGIKIHLVKLYNNHPQLLTDHLFDSYNSRLALGINSWQAVMYNALLNDIWFCSGGVLI